MPTLPAQKFAAVPMPELDPPVVSAGRPSKVSIARIAPWIVGIEAIACNGVVVGRHRRRRAGHPVGQFRHAGFGDDDGACIAQVLDQGGFVRRNESVEGASAPPVVGMIGGVDIVFDRDRDAVQRPANVCLGTLAVQLVGLFESVWVHGNRRVQLVFVQGDADKILRDQLSRCDCFFSIAVRIAGMLFSTTVSFWAWMRTTRADPKKAININRCGPGIETLCQKLYGGELCRVAPAGTDRSKYFFVVCLVPRNQFVGAKARRGCLAGGCGHSGVQLPVCDQLGGARGQAVDIAGGLEEAVLGVGNEFRNSSHAGGYGRHSTRHGFQRGQAE